MELKLTEAASAGKYISETIAWASTGLKNDDEFSGGTLNVVNYQTSLVALLWTALSLGYRTAVTWSSSQYS